MNYWERQNKKTNSRGIRTQELFPLLQRENRKRTVADFSEKVGANQRRKT
jgi:hypothetical protein